MPETATETIQITLPDGSTLELPSGATAHDAAGEIGPGLARDALAAKVDGENVDLERPLAGDIALEIITRQSPEALELLRHSAAHVLATAVREVRPEAKIGFGPAIDEGFYYDFEVEEPFTPEELEEIEGRMKEVVRRNDSFERRVVSKEEARGLFADDPLKLERLEEFGEDEVITVYRNGPFLDLCRGPHVPMTGAVGTHLKLLSTAGAYWRGDERRQMLQRIYGTAWFSKDDLQQYLDRIAEAELRDHRKLGKELGLFRFHPSAPGAPFWMDRGTTIYETLADWMRRTLAGHGYEHVKTPLLYNKELWQRSGHWGKYRDNMFLILDEETGEPELSLKPMNCPSHYLLYEAERHSYRELPIRYASRDVLHRNEVTGALSGLTRVRQFQQDDAHIFLAEDQIEAEVRGLVDLVDYFYSTLGLEYHAKFSTRPEQRLGGEELWDRAESQLRRALEATDLDYEEKPGEGAFYGPKVDFDVRDAIGRTWQLGTIQLDYAAPERFDLNYIGADDEPHRPVVIHRAIFGSFERFIAILIEHFAGAFPLWLAPEQVRVLPISDDQRQSADALADRLNAAGLRADVDGSAETLSYRIREGETEKIPYMAIVGAREAEAGTVAVRKRGAGKKQEVMERDAFVARARGEAEGRGLG